MKKTSLPTPENLLIAPVVLQGFVGGADTLINHEPGSDRLRARAGARRVAVPARRRAGCQPWRRLMAAVAPFACRAVLGSARYDCLAPPGPATPGLRPHVRPAWPPSGKK